MIRLSSLEEVSADKFPEELALCAEYIKAESNVRKMLYSLGIQTLQDIAHVTADVLKMFDISPAEKISFNKLKARAAQAVSAAADAKYKDCLVFSEMLRIYGHSFFAPIHLEHAYDLYLTTSLLQPFAFTFSIKKFAVKEDPKSLVLSFLLTLFICKVLTTEYHGLYRWVEEVMFASWSFNSIANSLEPAAKEIFQMAADKWSEIDTRRRVIQAYSGPADLQKKNHTDQRRQAPYHKGGKDDGKNKGGKKGDKGKGKKGANGKNNDPFACFYHILTGNCWKQNRADVHHAGETFEERRGKLSEARKVQFDAWKATRDDQGFPLITTVVFLVRIQVENSVCEYLFHYDLPAAHAKLHMSFQVCDFVMVVRVSSLMHAAFKASSTVNFS